MKQSFITEVEARQYFFDKTQGLHQITTEIVTTLSEDIVYQEHFTFFNFEENTKYQFSIFQTSKGYEVEIETIKYSKLVFAAETCDLKFFKEQINNSISDKALTLAFVRAIDNECIDILSFYYNNDYFNKLTLYKPPLVFTTYRDRLNSFIFFLEKGERFPENFLAYLLMNNSNKILQHILEDTDLRNEILKEKYLTQWALKYIEDPTRENETVTTFKGR